MWRNQLIKEGLRKTGEKHGKYKEYTHKRDEVINNHSTGYPQVKE